MARSLRKLVNSLATFFRHPLARSVGFTFAVDSFMFGSWVTHIPHVKSTLGMNDADLGLALFGLPLGLLAANPFSPGLIARFGLATTTTISTLGMALSFVLPVWMPGPWYLLASLFLAGVAIAVLNVGMNTCATNIERSEGLHIMSSCHGMWSMGGMLGSGISALLITMGVLPEVHLTAVGFLIAAWAWFGLRPVLKGVPEDRRSAGLRTGTPGFVWPNRELLLMIFIGISVSFGEGVAFDWSAVYLRDQLGASAQVAALGFTGFSLAMMVMRFTGDVLIPRFGARRLLFFCSAASALALLILVFAPGVVTGLLGFLLLGAGVALGAPILFNATARVPGYGQGAGLATYATFSFLGFLVGPPLLGMIGEHWGLPMAFGMVVILLLAMAPAIWKLRL